MAGGPKASTHRLPTQNISISLARQWNATMADFSDQNVFEMYVANGMQPGFWLQRTTWSNTCARVIEVGDIKGPPPYFGNPKVYAEIYDLRTGELKETGAKIPVPGTYKTWRMIDAPGWWVQPVT
jgi:hypothetical protein